MSDEHSIEGLGDVPPDWSIAPLSDFVEYVTYGFTNPMPDSEAGPFKLTAKDVSGGRILYETARHTTWEAYNELLTRKSRPAKGDVLLTKDGSIGRVAVVDRDDVCINQSVAVMRPKATTDARFLAYLLQTPHYQNRMAADSDGSTIKHIYITRVDKMLVAVPSRDEQQVIAAVLGSLDDKIEQNRRTGRALEELARATFKAWFMDFEPVKAKAAGAAGFPGMPPAAFAALPDHLTDSPLGPVPGGWAVGLLGDEVKIVKGRSYKSAELQESRTALVTLKSIERGGGYRADGLKPYAGVYKPDQVLNPGDLVVAFTDLTQDAAVVGKPAIVRDDARFDTLVASLDLGVIRPCGRLEVVYLYCLCKTDDFQRHIYGHTNGSTVLHLGKEGVPSYPITLPDVSTLAAFHQFAGPLFALIYASEAESSKLADLRDYLSPRLLSGRVRVRPSQAEVEP